MCYFSPVSQSVTGACGVKVVHVLFLQSSALHLQQWTMPHSHLQGGWRQKQPSTRVHLITSFGITQHQKHRPVRIMGNGQHYHPTAQVAPIYDIHFKIFV